MTVVETHEGVALSDFGIVTRGQMVSFAKGQRLTAIDTHMRELIDTSDGKVRWDNPEEDAKRQAADQEEADQSEAELLERLKAGQAERERRMAAVTQARAAAQAEVLARQETAKLEAEAAAQEADAQAAATREALESERLDVLRHGETPAPRSDKQVAKAKSGNVR